jgi:hypothetical protein
VLAALSNTQSDITRWRANLRDEATAPRSIAGMASAPRAGLRQVAIGVGVAPRPSPSVSAFPWHDASSRYAGSTPYTRRLLL